MEGRQRHIRRAAARVRWSKVSEPQCSSVIVTLVAALCTASCGNDAPPPPPQPTPEPPPPPIAPPPFPANTRSLQLTKTVAVRLLPNEESKRIGTLAIDTRVAWSETSDGPGCKKPWIHLIPNGWVCSEYVTPQTKAPRGQEIPHLDRDEVVPGVYGKIVAQGAMVYTPEPPPKKSKDRNKTKTKSKDKPKSAAAVSNDGPVVSTIEPTAKPMLPLRPVVGSMNVRKYGERTVAGKLYWKISDKAEEYVLRSAISQHTPSNYAGARAGDETGLAVPLGFVWPRWGGNYAWARRKAVGGGVTRQVMRRTAVGILETQNDAAGKPQAYRIGPDEWIDAAAVRMFRQAPLPRGLLPNERWIDIDLDSQILVAFEGELAVYTTMISSGAKDTPTMTGVYRMWKKVSETDMNGLNGEDPYSVATVPWTQFFSPEEGLAIHTAYWHDMFGTVRSHGCINVAPQDARWLYFWSDPQTPPGWSMSAGVIELPGSIVRVRSAAEPDPPERGYAKKVLEARTVTRPN